MSPEGLPALDLRLPRHLLNKDECDGTLYIEGASAC